MTPSAAYDAGVAAGRWQDDPAQRPALAEFDRIAAMLAGDAAPRGLLARLGLRGRPEAVRGLYLWGGVGRGKTFMMDLFYAQVPIERKRRAHFHGFMQDVHARLRELEGESDRLAKVADEIAAEIRLLALDEFFVSDIGDAMILGRLFDRLFALGVTLVTTSNTPPANLYRGGLQRARFLPAIALLERHCCVLELVSDQDYRLRELTQAEVYRVPPGEEADAALRERFDRLTRNCSHDGTPLTINGREIATVDHCDGVAWFRFEALCEGPRAVADYIEIAHHFHTVIVSGVPRFDGGNDDPARRFVHLIDELYDRQVNLLASAAASPVELYAGDRLAGEFERTASRLIEMRSAEYLAREHRG
ncbi:cell division protein ZapE [Coralloluteibacterium stylophorae]|uniref:AFG1 family ATPase n=1 Tax=Coralloluteibacterium stylophorae TaxID=1776034 RepID=A0A8J7VS79_9GAMM|nr:cell division protein ZapE [Coralloluteibacterium stylophorae]MBS7458099.1 AFG1 family ATPase [Coralloluteibacterium stylophorae]